MKHTWTLLDKNCFLRLNYQFKLNNWALANWPVTEQAHEYFATLDAHEIDFKIAKPQRTSTYNPNIHKWVFKNINTRNNNKKYGFPGSKYLHSSTLTLRLKFLLSQSCSPQNLLPPWARAHRAILLKRSSRHAVTNVTYWSRAQEHLNWQLYCDVTVVYSLLKYSRK